MTLRRIALAIALAVAAGPVAALGLGQIQVKSRVDQPLLAEIPIVSSDPAELEQLQARLASPETFARIGLEPPTGAAADLQFMVALDDRGRPVIRVTSSQPVNEPLVTFLVEVDWGSGRLVREYSALLDTPRTVAAPAQPPIDAPTVAPSNMIERPVASAPVEAEPVGQPVPQAEDPTPEASPDSNAIAADAPPAPEPEPAPVTAAPAAPTPADRMVVRDGQTLSQIASSVSQRGYTLDQTMLALLRANPDAFIKGNVNLLKSGAVLRVPPAQDAAELAPREAAAVVRDHLEQWRALSAPAPQPASVASDAAASPSNTAKAAAAASSASNTGARVAGARLEIVPPSDRAANTPGSRSGASAGGEGDMLRQQELQQTKEDLAARNAEVEDLKSRVAELEKLQQDQAALIAMKDSKLAAAEQRLAQSNDAQAATTQTATTQATPPQQQASTPAWLWGGAGLLVVGVVAWLFTRRRKVAPIPRRAYDTEAMAAGLPIVDGAADAAAREAFASDEPAPLFAEEDTKPAAPHWTSAPAKFGSAPTWHAGGNAPGVDTAVAEPQTATQQIDLARAYLDMGDDDAARVILREVLATSRDPIARDTAARMLREL